MYLFCTLFFTICNILHVNENQNGLPGGTVEKNPPANAGTVRDVGSIPGSGRSPGGGHGNLQYSCLENPLDKGAWRATVHEVQEPEMTEATARTHRKQYWFSKPVGSLAIQKRKLSPSLMAADPIFTIIKNGVLADLQNVDNQLC